MSTLNKFLFTVLYSIAWVGLYAQGLSKNDIDIRVSDSPHPGRVVVSYIKNNYSEAVMVRFRNEYGGMAQTVNLQAGEQRQLDITCNIVDAKPEEGVFIDIIRRPKPKEEKSTIISEVPQKKEQASQQVRNNTKIPIGEEVKPIPKRDPVGIDVIIPDFIKYIESIPFYSIASIEEEASKIEEHINNLRNWKDKDAYIRENHLNSYVAGNRDSLKLYKKNTSSLITEYFGQFDNREIINKSECIDSIQTIITNRLDQRETNINRLSDEINNTPTPESFDWKRLDKNYLGIGAGVILLLLLLFIWYRKANKKNRTTTSANNGGNTAADVSSAIVVRRKTTSILRKQSLEDVIGSDSYLKIDCNEFCNDSAVRTMYIKNTCIKDIYNMYAEDLRNPNNPKEDGCMVLGRWVHDAESNEYYVSLEHIVLPGDDAVFTEYELNFGGKIKLKVTEKLRKLRRETNLQYDLTCWVHSHPGLGIFFSNSDSNVQMQLKHPTHPNFLTAIVVDILTPRQELGIFTFKRDLTISSKTDLKKLYSLEELYKWAVESDRNSFKPEDHYNILADAKSHKDDCHGIELSNGVIIDMAKLVDEQGTGLVGMIHGFSNQQGLKTENVAVTITKNEAVPDNELVGCFIMATHCSIPSIRKIVADYLNKIKFVLVYTTMDGLVTSIPVISNEICTDETYYGEQKLENLKIWTRRKR